MITAKAVGIARRDRNKEYFILVSGERLTMIDWTEGRLVRWKLDAFSIWLFL